MVRINARDAPDLPSHDCDGPVRVLVQQQGGGVVGLPVIDDGVVVHYRKDGPLSVSTRAEVDIPLTGLGEDWYEWVDAFDEEGGMQQAAIGMKQVRLDGSYSDNYRNVMRGYIGGVGSAGDNVGHLTIYGPFKFIDQIPAGHTFNPGSTPYDFVNYIANELNDSQDIIDDIAISGEDIYGKGVPDSPVVAAIASSPTVQNPALRQSLGIEDIEAIGQSKSFTVNRHTLADVAKFVLERWEFKLFFRQSPTGDIFLTGIDDPGTNYDATGKESFVENTVESLVGELPDLEPIHNNALFEMKPFNTIVVKGQQSGPLGPAHIFSESEIDAERVYPEAEAWYPPLVERAGGKITTETEVQSLIPAEAEGQARTMLKQQLDDVSGGTITFPLSPSLFPFDRIRSYPACRGIISEKLPALTYEVERVAHRVVPNENDIPQTEVAVSMAVDPNRIESNVKVLNAQPASDSDNAPQSTPPWKPDFDT